MTVRLRVLGPFRTAAYATRHPDSHVDIAAHAIRSKRFISILAFETVAAAAAAGMADQKDMLDKTIQFLQKREGIDKVNVVLYVPA